jgi:hypothetical protein
MLTGNPSPLTAEAAAPAPKAGPESQTEQFLKRILPAPGPGRYVSIHSLFVTQGRKSLPGKGFDSVESATAHIHKWNWIARKAGRPFEQHFHCMGVLGRVEPQTDKRGNAWLKTDRHQNNIALIRSIFMDLDVKSKAFASQVDAAKAIAGLVASGDIPAPTMLVDSGYGLHAYWVLNRDMTPQEWQPLAEGMGRFLQSKGIFLDPLYGDYSRVLRPPGAWNMKDPATPKQVRIVGRTLSHDYDPSLFTKFIPFANVATLPSRGGAAVGAGGAVGGVAGTGAGGAGVIPLLPRLPAIAVPGELSQGVEHVSQPVSMAVAVERCAVLRDVSERGGEGDPEPFWRQVLLASSFDPRGREWAHKLSEKHAGYTKESTDAKFDLILAQRAQAGGRVGWPTCATFSKHSNACQACPFQGRVRSPFNLAADDSDLPKGYSRKDSMIWKDKADEDENGNPIPAVAFPYGMRDAFLESAPDGLTLNVEVTLSHETPRRLRLPVVAINTWRDKVHMILGQCGLALPKNQNHLAQEFFVAFIHHLQAVAASGQRRQAVGWTKSKGGAPAFAFGGKAWVPSGGFENTSGIDPVLESTYNTAGTLDAWKQAADFIIKQRRTDLQIILASAFAGPLVRFTGQSGLMLSAYSPRSGVQKSTAMQVALAAWAHPIQAMNRVDDTYNAVMHKLGVLRHLPLFWDEIQTPEQAELGFVKMAFAVTQGTEKSRLTSDVQQRGAGSWATMLVSASNFSMQDTMLRSAKNTTAGLNRVFEITVQPPPAHAIVSATYASAMVALCQENYGHAGEIYAQMLARDESLLRARLTRVAADFEKQANATPEERFWIFSAAVIFLGAVLAKAEGLVDFDLPAMRTYLIQAIKAQRHVKVSNTFDVTSPDYAATILARYVNHCRRRNVYLETDIFWTGRGAIPIEVKMSEESRKALRSPFVHMARDAGVLRVLRVEFHDWMDEAGIPVRAVLEGLTLHGGMQSVRPTWAQGTEWASARLYAYELKLTGGSSKGDAVGNFFQLGLNGPINGAALPATPTK